MPIDHILVGKEYPPVTYEIGREKIREYARAVGDLNPLYLAESTARTSRYGEIIAPPLMASQYTLLPAALLVGDPEVGIDFQMLLHSEQEYRYCSVVRAGDRLTMVGRIKNIYEKRALQFVEFETTVTNQNAELVVVALSTFVMRPRAGDQP